MAGVPQYAVYLMHRYYNDEISLAKAQALADYLFVEKASQDRKVVGHIKVGIVKPRGYEALTKLQVETIHKKNDSLNKRLRQFFAPGGRT